VSSVTFLVVGEGGRVLLHDTFDTPEALSTLLLVSPPTASATPAWKPIGTVVLEPGDMGVAFLAGLTEPRFEPVLARVTMEFDRAPARTLLVPLKAFVPQQQMGWPLRFDGRRWIAFNTAGTAHHWMSSTVFADREVLSSQRFALDIAEIDSYGQTHPSFGNKKEFYYAWGEEVVSAGRGRVVAAISGERDLEIGEAPSPLDSPAGNFIVIQHSPRLFSVYAHLQQAGTFVNVGDSVERGQIIGLVGNSGDSTQPHLHMHFTDAWPRASTPFESFVLSQGVPAVFWGAQVLRDGSPYDMNGSTPLEFDMIISSYGAR
jgi:peptidase M23-like protein